MEELTLKLNEYLQVLDLAFHTANALKGKPSIDHRLPDCQHVAQKLVSHAATVYWLRQGTKTPAPYSEGGMSFYDFASVTVLTRVILETYLTLFEVFFETTTEDELEFNHAYWQLSGFIIREGFVPIDSDLQSQAADSQKEIQEMRNRIQKTEKFISLKPGEQREVLRGKWQLPWIKVAKSAGFSEEIIRRTYAYTSGYIHSDGLSGAQIAIAKTDQDQIQHLETNMLVVMVVLSKMILEYSKKFPESKEVCEKSPEAFSLASIWSNLMNDI